MSGKGSLTRPVGLPAGYRILILGLGTGAVLLYGTRTHARTRYTGTVRVVEARAAPMLELMINFRKKRWQAVVDRFAVLCKFDTRKVGILRDPNSAADTG